MNLRAFLLPILFHFCYGITKITYSDSNCNQITAIEQYHLSQCKILSLGGQLFSVKINICNSTSWETFVHFNSINCTNPYDLLSFGPSNECFLSGSNLYEKIICNDVIQQVTSSANIFSIYMYVLYVMFIILIL